MIYLNWSYNDTGNTAQVSENIGEATMVDSKKTEEKKETNKEDNDILLLSEAKSAKDKGRSKAMELLNNVLENEKSDSNAKENALSELTAMANNMEAEGVIEGILKTKGYEKSVVFITDKVATVAVKTDKPLTGTDVAKIQDIVKSNGSVSGEKITITEVKD